MSRNKNVDTYSRVPIMQVVSNSGVNGYAKPVPDSAIALTERVLAQASNECTNFDNLYTKSMLDELGIDAPGFPITPLSLPLSLKKGPSTNNADLSFLNDTPRLAKMMLVLLKTINVVAVDYDTEGNNDYSLLGLYVPNPKHIELHSRLIYENSNNVSLLRIAEDFSFDSYSVLCCIVLIHELAHAVMDVENYNLADKYSYDYSNNYLINDFCGATEHSLLYYKPGQDDCNRKKQWISFKNVREESYANVITYKVISNADRIQRINGIQWYLSTFINSQSPQYALATLLAEKNNIMGWVDAKIHSYVDKDTAIKWMEKAAVLFKSNIADIKEFETIKEECREVKKQVQKTNIDYHRLMKRVRGDKVFLSSGGSGYAFFEWESQKAVPWASK